MREMLQHRGMRLLVTANLISMIGSGMNAAAVIWYILQATHSEVSLGLLVALQALIHHVRVWQLYGMTILVSVGFWIFWPTINALVQELAPEDKLLDSNSLMLAAVQGGWVLAGAMVGFVYNKIGLGGILLVDCATYGVSIACVYHVRKGRVTVSHLAPPSAAAPVTAVARY